VRLACHALVTRGDPRAEIAAAHGFYDQSHLVRELRRETGVTPSEGSTRTVVPRASLL
jgi:AraC-like DNA-binding protein